MEMRMQLAREMSTRAGTRLFGVSHSTMARMKQQANPVAADGTVAVTWVEGLDNRKRPSRPLDTAERDARIIELFRDGESTRAISANAGCSVGTVHRVIKAHKVAVVKRSIDRSHEAMGGSASTARI